MPGDHFYTTSQVERDNAFAFLGYIEEGTACFVFDAPSPGTTPFYRLYNPTTGDHFYTTSKAEADNAVRTYGYQAEGIAPGWIRSIVMPSLSHQTESLLRLKRLLGEAKGTPLSERMAWGKPRSLNKRSNATRIEGRSVVPPKEC